MSPGAATPAPLPGERSVPARPDTVELLLRKGGCPACRAADEAEDRFFTWFAIETHTAAEMVHQLRASAGMCPAHTRRLLRDGEPTMLSTVYRETAKGTRRLLAHPEQRAQCPACASIDSFVGHVLEDLSRALAVDPIARRFRESGGACLRHVLEFARHADPAVLALACETLSARLIQQQDPEARRRALDGLTGSDRDAAERARWRARLPHPETPPEALESGRGTLAGLCDRLALDACPVCLTGGLAEECYLAWLLAERRAHGKVLAQDPGELCTAHIADLALLDPATADAAVSHAAPRWRAELEGAAASIREELERRAGLRESARKRQPDAAAAARKRLARGPRCPACEAVAIARGREDALLSEALALPGVARAYTAGHGLCLSDIIAPARTHAAHAPVTAMLRDHVGARLGVLAWELEESSRKEAWACRHERKGPERSAYLRFPAQVDGRGVMGAPAISGSQAS